MRPLKLTIQGLRSYRQRQEIEFPDGLFAITGQTGAGKSSILEAIVFALYGSATFEGNNNRILIGDRCDEMLVSLDFQVQKQRYRVTRSLTAKNASHELEGPDGQLIATKAQDVNAQIEQLLGLTRDDFLKTVVLPQGAFQNFLHSTPAKRAELLKNLLELSVLDQMQEEVSKQRTQLQAQLAGLVALRQSLDPNPELGLSSAEELIKISQAEISRSKLLLQSRQALDTVHKERQLQSQRLQSNLQQLQSASVMASRGTKGAQGDTEWLELAELGLKLSGKTAQLRQHLEVKNAEQLALQQKLSQQRTVLNRQFKELRKAHQLQAQLSESSGRLSHLQNELQLLQSEIAAVNESLPSIAALLLATQDLWTAQSQGRQDSKMVLDQLEKDLLRHQHALALQQNRDSEIASKQAQLTENRQKIRPIEADLDRYQSRLASLQQELSKLQNEIGIAALCSHISPGDPCPICRSTIPQDWTEEPPTKLAQDRNRVELSLADASGEFKKLERQQTEIRIRNNQLESELCRLIDLRAEQPEIPNLDQLQEHLESLKLKHSELENEFEQCSARLHQQRAQCQSENLKLEQLQSRQSDLSRKVLQVNDQMVPYQLELETLGQQIGQQTLKPFPAEPKAVELWLAEIHDLLEHQQQSIETAERELQAQQSEQAKLQLELQETENQYRGEYLRPLEDRISVLQSLRQLTKLLVGENDADEQPIEGLADQLRSTSQADQSLIEKIRAAWSQSVERVRSLEEELRQQDDKVQESLTKIKQQQSELSAADGPQTVEELSGHLENLYLEHGQLEAQRNQMLAQQVQAAELDTQIAPLQEQSHQLGALSDLLGNKAGKNKRTTFSQWLLQQRQEQLIYLASDFLKKFSHGQFGFDPDFQIQDMSTGNSRKTSTLSGGETFLASLALALALSELVSRKGGRLEAFFIDEGFGSLSPECLDRALSALETIAQSGRTIGVISHVSVMAERIEQVWNVTKTPLGSQIQIMSEEIRQRILAEDLKQLESLGLPLFS